MENPSIGSSTVKGITYYYYTFNTRTILDWNDLYEKWYPLNNKLKVIPEKIENVLTPISLAFWLMDDGGWTKPGIPFNTNHFIKTDVERISIILNEKFNLKCSIHSRNRIYIHKKSVLDLIEIIRPHVHYSMRNKIEI